MIEQLTGIKRSAKQVGVFLKKLGLKRLKTYAVPAKMDSEVQETFKKRTGATRRSSKSRDTNRLFCR
jgi:transposase